MIAPGSGTRIVIATRPVDFRKQADSLAALVAADLAESPYSGTIYVFRSKRRDRVKLIGFDGSGLWLFAKRLETRRFEWPEIADGVMKMSAAQLAALLDGVESHHASPFIDRSCNPVRKACFNTSAAGGSLGIGFI